MLGMETASRPRIPVRFIKHGELSTDEDGLPAVKEFPGPSVQAIGISIAFRDGPMISHYFHFLEMLIAAYMVTEECFPGLPVNCLYFGAQEWNNPRQNHVQRHLIDAIYPGAVVFDHSAPPPSATVQNVLVLDRELGGSLTTINKFLEPFLPYRGQHGQRFRERVWHAAAATVDTVNPRKVAGYVVRNAPRTLSPEMESKILALIGRDYEIVTLDFSAMPWERQVRSVRDLDLMFGVHGNGLTNVSWMKAGAMLIEIFPENCHHYDYQIQCEIFGIRYFGVEGKERGGYLLREGTRAGSPYGVHPAINATVSAIPLGSLLSCMTPDG